MNIINNSKELLNESKADNHIEKNKVSNSEGALSELVKKEVSKLKGNAFCSNTGLELRLRQINYSSLVDTATASLRLDIKTFSAYALDNRNSRKDLYELDINVLSALVISVYFNSIKTLVSNNGRVVDNILLQTAGKAVLINLLFIARQITDNSIDKDLLPSFDISVETHNTGVDSLNMGLFGYVEELTKIVNSLTLTGAQKLQNRRLVRLNEQADKERIKTRLLEKANANVLNSYENKRIVAKKAFNSIKLELIYMNYKKLVSLLEVAVNGGASNLSTEVKDKVLLRLDEISTKITETTNDVTTINNIDAIKALFKVSKSESLTKYIQSGLESVSNSIKEVSTNSTDSTGVIENKRMSLKERLELLKSKA